MNIFIEQASSGGHVVMYNDVKIFVDNEKQATQVAIALMVQLGKIGE